MDTNRAVNPMQRGTGHPYDALATQVGDTGRIKLFLAKSGFYIREALSRTRFVDGSELTSQEQTVLFAALSGKSRNDVTDSLDITDRKLQQLVMSMGKKMPNQ